MNAGLLTRFFRDSTWSLPIWALGIGVTAGIAMTASDGEIVFGFAFILTQLASLAIHFGVHQGQSADRPARSESLHAAALRDNFHLVWMAILDGGSVALIGSVTEEWTQALPFLAAAGAMEIWSLGLHQRMHHKGAWFGHPSTQLAQMLMTILSVSAALLFLL